MKAAMLQALLIIVVSSLAGCASSSSSLLVPGGVIEKTDRLFIVRQEDDRGLHDHVSGAFADLGFGIIVGTEEEIASAEADVIVRYMDQWIWDLGWYLGDLQIRFYDREDGLLIASAHASHTSLARRSPKTMVEEALQDLFNGESK